MRLSEISRIPQSEVNSRSISDGIARSRATKRQSIGQVQGVKVSMGLATQREYDVLFAEGGFALGYALLAKSEVDGIEGFFVTEIGLKDKLRGRGIGLGFYHLLLDLGYTLFSGTTQTPNGEGVWKRLMADASVSVEIRNIDGAPVQGDPWFSHGNVIVARKA